MHSTPPLGISLWRFVWKTRMAWLPEDMFIHFDKMYERDRRMSDGRTDTAWRQRPRLTLASPGSNNNNNKKKVCSARHYKHTRPGTGSTLSVACDHMHATKKTISTFSCPWPLTLTLQWVTWPWPCPLRGQFIFRPFATVHILRPTYIEVSSFKYIHRPWQTASHNYGQ